MISYVFMKILEGRPRSYDKKMEKVSGGRVRVMKEAVAAEVQPNESVLEIGCGTGELAAMMIAGGAKVEAFDSSPSMVEVARERIEKEKLDGSLQVEEMGVDGMDAIKDNEFNTVVSTLVFSELSDDERHFALKHAYRVLRPGGNLVIADEVVPRTGGRRLLHALARAPLAAMTYLASSSVTRPIADLSGEVSTAGFKVQKEDRTKGDTSAILVAQRPLEETSA